MKKVIKKILKYTRKIIQIKLKTKYITKPSNNHNQI